VYVGDGDDRVPASVLSAGRTEFCRGDADGTALASAVNAVVGDQTDETTTHRLEAMPDPAYATDPGGRVEWVNRAFLEQFGHGSVGKPVESVLPLPGDGGVEVTIQDGAGTRTYERRERSTERGTVGVLREVTERKARRDRRRRIEQRYRRMVEQDLFGIYIIHQGTIRFANRRAAEMFGYEPEAMIDEMTVFDVVAEEDHDRLRENIRKRERGDVEELRYDLTGVRRDGSQFQFEVHSGVVEYDGEPALLGAIIDVTDRRRRRQRLQVLNRVLRHNLRNDLNVVIGRLEEAIDRLRRHGDERGAEVVAQGLKEAHDLVSTSEKLRKIQETLERDGKEDPRVDAVGSVERIVEFVRGKYPEATVETDLPETATVKADQALELVVENLLTNAIEHTEDPAVEVSIAKQDRKRGRWYQLQVEDDGPGIPEQEQVVVDETVDVTPLRHSSGVGLWTVAWVVQSFDGSVEIATEDVDGTVVTVSLRAGD
jgi:PAS domain S-box-containing protein